jgi:hypothetical protein
MSFDVVCAQLATLSFFARQCIRNIQQDAAGLGGNILSFNQSCMSHSDCGWSDWSGSCAHTPRGKTKAAPPHHQQQQQQAYLIWGIQDNKTQVRIQTWVLPSESRIVVVFRPTSNAHNWMSNLDCASSWTSPQLGLDDDERDECQVHHGFEDMLVESPVLRRLLVQLHTMLDSLANPPKSSNSSSNSSSSGKSPPVWSVWLVGMSLGGGLAPLSVPILRSELPRSVPLHCITFGAPRFGNEAMNKAVMRRLDSYMRFVAPYDLIPHLPPTLTHHGSGTEVSSIHRKVLQFDDWLYSGARSSGLSPAHIAYMRAQNQYGHGYYLGVWFHWGFDAWLKKPEIAFVPERLFT